MTPVAVLLDSREIEEWNQIHRNGGESGLSPLKGKAAAARDAIRASALVQDSSSVAGHESRESILQRVQHRILRHPHPQRSVGWSDCLTLLACGLSKPLVDGQRVLMDVYLALSELRQVLEEARRWAVVLVAEVLKMLLIESALEMGLILTSECSSPGALQVEQTHKDV